MRAIFKHLREAAMEPHLTNEQFRMCVLKAIDHRDKEAHESFDAAFQRYIQEAIFEYEREHFAK